MPKKTPSQINLSLLTDEELETELKRRKQCKKPPILSTIDWKSVIAFVEETLIDLEDGYDVSAGFDLHLQDTVLEAMYGQDIWKYWNSKTNNNGE